MGEFKPKNAVQLNPPKSDPISLEELAKADGEFHGACIFVSAHSLSLAVHCAHARCSSYLQGQICTDAVAEYSLTGSNR